MHSLRITESIPSRPSFPLLLRTRGSSRIARRLILAERIDSRIASDRSWISNARWEMTMADMNYETVGETGRIACKFRHYVERYRRYRWAIRVDAQSEVAQTDLRHRSQFEQTKRRICISTSSITRLALERRENRRKKTCALLLFRKSADRNRRNSAC